MSMIFWDPLVFLRPWWYVKHFWDLWTLLDLRIICELLDICSGSFFLRLSLIHYHIYFSSEWLLQGKFLIVIYRIECNIKIFLLTNFIIPGLLQRCGRWLLRTRVCLILSNYSQFQLAPAHQSLIKKNFWNILKLQQIF